MASNAGIEALRARRARIAAGEQPATSAARKPSAGRVLHTVRTRDGDYVRLALTRSLAIKVFCTECMGWDVPSGPLECGCDLCPLFPFRGKSRAAYGGKRDGDDNDEESTDGHDTVGEPDVEEQDGNGDDAEE